MKLSIWKLLAYAIAYAILALIAFAAEAAKEHIGQALKAHFGPEDPADDGGTDGGHGVK